MRLTDSPSRRKPQTALPKNGGSQRYSVGICRLAPGSSVPFRRLVKLTAVISIKSRVSRGTITAGMQFALTLLTHKIGFPGWPEPILDSVTGFGASIAKRGLAPAPFFISRLRQRTSRPSISCYHRDWLELPASAVPSRWPGSHLGSTKPVACLDGFAYSGEWYF